MGNMTKWKDVSSYSQSDKEKIPNVFKRKAGWLTITVHKHIHYDQDQWLVSCPPFFDCKELASKKIDEAKCQAVALVQVKLEEAIAELLSNEGKV